MLLIATSCKKNNTQEYEERTISSGIEIKEILSSKSKDLSVRLDNIRSSFYSLKLNAVFAPKDDTGIFWEPEWNEPKIQTVNDSISYVFYRLKANVKKDGKLLEAEQLGGANYLMVKNEREFYRAFYLPADQKNKMQTAKSIMGKFTGKLLLMSLQGKRNFLLDYNNGSVSDAYKKLRLISKKPKSAGAGTSYWEQECNWEQVFCEFFSMCPGVPTIYFSPDCSEPNSCYGYWQLNRFEMREVCATVWYDDPPTDPEDPNGGGDPGGENNGGIPVPPSNSEVESIIANRPFALFDDVDCVTLKKWLALAKHEVDQSIIDKLGTVSITPFYGTLSDRIAAIQSINDAHSTVVNMDYFSVTVTTLPTVNGQQLTPEQLHRYIRINVNDFTDGADFSPYNANGVDDTSLWNSVNPKGALVKIDMPGPDNGTVITSFSSANAWTFTTVYEPMYGEHPVSGHRDFGFVVNSNGSFTFYTRGVDRLTSWDGTFVQQAANIPFSAADDLWTSFQTNIRAFVNNNGGAAYINSPEILRPNWEMVKDVLAGRQPLSKLTKNCPD